MFCTERTSQMLYYNLKNFKNYKKTKKFELKPSTSKLLLSFQKYYYFFFKKKKKKKLKKYTNFIKGLNVIYASNFYLLINRFENTWIFGFNLRFFFILLNLLSLKKIFFSWVFFLIDYIHKRSFFLSVQ